MICLGIESTAHTFGIAVMKDKKELSSAAYTFTTEKGGMNPPVVAEHHKKVKDGLLKKALQEAKVSLEDIELISFSKGPGLAPCLHIGKNLAVELAQKIKAPLIGVSHICAHLEIGRMVTNTKDPVFVFVSGANTQIIAHEGGRYRVFGETLSIGLGNALDKFGRIAGLGFPAGPKIEQLAKSSKLAKFRDAENPRDFPAKGKLIELPYVVKGMDVDFAGIITKAEMLFKKGANIEDLCFSLQETCFAMLTEVTERAVAHCDKKEVILIGGVAANRRFCEMLDAMCRERDCKFYPVPLKYCGDNPVMIAWQGILEYSHTKREEDLGKVEINPKWRIDEMYAEWY